MRVTMNFFYLGKSFILVQRSLILSIIVCSVFFSGCALEEPEKETSSNSPSEGASLYSTILQELETNLSSTNSSRSHQNSSSAKTSVSTSLSSSQISAVVEAARQAILEKSLEDNENIGDLYPEILQAALAKLGALNLSSNETVKAISAINWSLLKSSKLSLIHI